MTTINPSWLHWLETKALIKAVAPLRFVGGCVRDAILGLQAKDVDATTPLLPEQVIAALKSAGIKAVPTGIDHGTVTAVIGKKHFEITTLRRDVSTDGRRATVAYTEDWREDAERRDFTMNALYCDAVGNVTDYFHGIEDAHAGCVRFIGEARARIEEDALRILRFFRFFAHYGREAVDVEGLAACGSLAGSLKNLSGERIQMEMLKLLVAPRAADVVILMQQYNVWGQLVPERVGVQTLRALPQVMDKVGHLPDAILALAALLRTIRHPERSEGSRKDGMRSFVASAPQDDALVNSISTRWKLSKAHARRLMSLCELGAVEFDFDDEKSLRKQIRKFGKELFIDNAILLMAEGQDEALGISAVALAKNWQIPEFPVNGNDLAVLGIKPGKEMGRLLDAMEAAWEESDYAASKEELLKR